MTNPEAAAQRVAEATDAWLREPLRASQYKAMVAAVLDWRRLSPQPADISARSQDPAAATGGALPGSVDASTRAKMHRDLDFLRAKQNRLHEPHVAPIQALVEQIRATRDTQAVPYVDPASGGVRARVLFLLESPAGPAALGSGMLSPDNDDDTAANMWELYRRSGLSRAAALHWNAVPWYVGADGRNAAVGPADVAEGVQWLERLVALLPDLRLVVAMGVPAANSMKAYSALAGVRAVEWRAVMHPGMRNKNSRAERWPQVEKAFTEARLLS